MIQSMQPFIPIMRHEVGEQISIVIPMYNEQDRIQSTLREIERFMREDEWKTVGEVVVVDDGSKDMTVERCMYFMSRLPLRVERLSENAGKWAAIHHGIGVAKCDWVLLLDADGSASVWELQRLGVDWRSNRTKAYFGSRFAEGSSCVGKTYVRQLVSRVYRRYVQCAYWMASGKHDVDDMQCPFKLLRKSRLMEKETMDVHRFAGDIELACRYNGEIETLPVDFVHVRGSKVPASAIVQMAWETFKVAIRERRRRMI